MPTHLEFKFTNKYGLHVDYNIRLQIMSPPESDLSEQRVDLAILAFDIGQLGLH
jgi:hypothetical protein